jgi:hypothetical protein
MVAADFHVSMINFLIFMSHEMPGCISRHEPAKGSDSASARNTCIKRVGLDTVDYCLFVDSDMAFPRSALKTLLSRGKKVISGVNFQKHEDFKPTIYNRNTSGDLENIEDFEVDQLFTVEGTGGAFLLVHTDVLKKISRRHGEKWFEWTPGMSEDLAFCSRVRESGEEIWVDSSVFTDHYTMAPRGMEEFLRRKEDKRKASGEKILDKKGNEFDPVKFREEMIIPPRSRSVEGSGDLLDQNKPTGSAKGLKIQTVE